MARVLLPCEVEEWWEDKRLFLLLSSMRTIGDLSTLITAHTREDSEPSVLSKRLKQLSGLVTFLEDYCTEEERTQYVRVTLPFIARSASKLDELVPESGIPFIVNQEAASLVLGRKLVLSLIANAFLCTFPKANEFSHIRVFSFKALFEIFTTRIKEGAKEKKSKGDKLNRAAKIKCLLCYFNKVAEGRADLSGVITLRRQVIPNKELPSLTSWTTSRKPLCSLKVETQGNIEESGSHTLQVDFANRKIGGGAIRVGCLQEEIKFVVFPELLVSMLVMDHMANNEAIIITGTEQFSKYTGYRETFEFAGEHQDTSERDVFGNFLTSTVAIDAISFRGDPEKQHEPSKILRDLNKAYTGFLCMQDRGDISAELVALSTQGPSMAFIAEYYASYHSPTASKSALGNLNAPSQPESGIELTFKPGLFAPDHNMGPPLSPIKELSESTLYTSITDSIIKVGVHEATKKEDEEPSESATVSQYASSLTSSLFSQAVPERFAPKSTSSLFNGIKSVAKSSDPVPDPKSQSVDDFVSSLTSSLVGEAQPKQAPPKPVSDNCVDQFAASMTNSLFNSAQPPAVKASNPKAALSPAQEEINTLARSIVTDVLSSFEPASMPEPATTKTMGEPTNQALGAFSDQVASNIMSSAFSLTQPISGKSSDHPAIFIQVERRGSSGAVESPKTSRSSSITGQSITMHEFTDDLAETLIRDGVSIAQYTSQSLDLAAPAQLDQEEAAQLAEKLTLSIMESVKESAKPLPPAPPRTLLPPEEQPDGRDSPSMPRKNLKHRLLFSKQELAVVAARMAKCGSFDTAEPSDTETPFQLNPRLLTPSSSRHSMGYAWSTASTRDEGSRPVSPTDMDRIALGLVNDPEEYFHIFTKILVSDAVLSASGERPKRLRQGELGSEYGFLNMNSLPSESKIDTYLSRLEQAEVLSQSSADDAVTPQPPLQQKLKKVFLRPIATGNWGCGAFRGDPQLKSLLQWMVASRCERPQMIYYTFNNEKIKELSRVVEHVQSKKLSVGQLCKMLLDYSGLSSEQRAEKDLFTTLLET